jgi:thymidine kinase
MSHVPRIIQPSVKTKEEIQMVTLIAGKKGSGKSKEIVRRANEALEAHKGDMIFIDDDSRAMYDLHHDIRFVDISKFPVKNTCEFLGFICGLISNNYDIQTIYIDGIMNTVRMTQEELVEWFSRIDEVSDLHKINFVVTLNYESELPEGLHRYQ